MAKYPTPKLPSDFNRQEFLGYLTRTKKFLNIQICHWAELVDAADNRYWYSQIEWTAEEEVQFNDYMYEIRTARINDRNTK